MHYHTIHTLTWSNDNQNEALKRYLKERPDAFLNEIALHFGVTAPAIHAAMKRMNITRKKRARSIKNDLQAREVITSK